MCARSLFLAVALTLLFALNTTAGTITFGPVPDFAGYLTQTSTMLVPTEFTSTFHIPGDGYVSIHIHDSMYVRVTTPVPVFVPSYVRIKIIGDPQIEGPLSFFDIYAQDLDPVNPGTNLTGFNATNPEIIPLTAERFIGVSGTEYMAPVQAVYLSQLSSVVPDFDLSAFSGGDPRLDRLPGGTGQYSRRGRDCPRALHARPVGRRRHRPGGLRLAKGAGWPVREDCVPIGE